MSRLRRPATAAALLVALVSAGCLLVSGQFVVTYDFAEHGYDPVTVASPLAVVGVPIDLNAVSAYREHKQDLKDVSDLAVVGTVTNLDPSAAAEVEIWIVRTPGSPLVSDAAVRAAGVRVWGPLHVEAGGVRAVGWNDSARLFVGRDALVGEIKGDGRFDLYALGSNGYQFRISKAAVIAVIGAGK